MVWPSVTQPLNKGLTKYHFSLSHQKKRCEYVGLTVSRVMMCVHAKFRFLGSCVYAQRSGFQIDTVFGDEVMHITEYTSY